MNFWALGRVFFLFLEHSAPHEGDSSEVSWLPSMMDDFSSVIRKHSEIMQSIVGRTLSYQTVDCIINFRM